MDGKNSISVGISKHKVSIVRQLQHFQRKYHLYIEITQGGISIYRSTKHHFSSPFEVDVSAGIRK
jgi:hypothetical protein